MKIRFAESVISGLHRRTTQEVWVPEKQQFHGTEGVPGAPGHLQQVCSHRSWGDPTRMAVRALSFPCGQHRQD